MRAALLGLVVCACAAPRAAAPADDLDTPAPADVRAYTLALHGARIGDARERELRDDGGVVLVTDERLRVRRGGVLEATDVKVVVIADRALRASRVEWRERSSAGPPRLRRAIRDATGWRLEVDGEPPARAPADAVPDELVPLQVRERGGFRGNVLLAGRGLAIGYRTVERSGPRALRTTLATAAGAETAEVTLDDDGAPRVIAGSDGVIARRAPDAAIAAPFDPPEVVDTAAIPLDRAAPDDGAPLALVVRGVTRAPPPDLPGQRAIADPDRPGGWRVSLTATRATDAVTPLRAIAHDVFAAGDGDCTAHALAFAARATAAGFATKIVTGWRVDGVRLVRHRWAIAFAGGAWIPIDPSYDEAPAAPRLVGLATSEPTAAGVGIADLAYGGTEGATAELTAACARGCADRPGGS